MNKVIEISGTISKPKLDFTPSDRVCGNCRHCYRDDQTGELSVCRRYPPAVVLIPQTNSLGLMNMALQSAWPLIMMNHTCSEYGAMDQLLHD